MQVVVVVGIFSRFLVSLMARVVAEIRDIMIVSRRGQSAAGAENHREGQEAAHNTAGRTTPPQRRNRRLTAW